MKKLYCEYCGMLLSDGCDCLKDIEDEKNDLIEELEQRQSDIYILEDLMNSRDLER